MHEYINLEGYQRESLALSQNIQTNIYIYIYINGHPTKEKGASGGILENHYLTLIM